MRNQTDIYNVSESEFNAIVASVTLGSNGIDKGQYVTMFSFVDHSYAILDDTMITIYGIGNKILGSFWRYPTKI